MLQGICISLHLFQSTLPAREATLQRPYYYLGPAYFNPRFPRRKQRHDNDIDDNFTAISIHASREGSDRSTCIAQGKGLHFNPRFPRGKRPAEALQDFIEHDFNPRFPRGKRPISYSMMYDKAKFQSTLPAGEATAADGGIDIVPTISIHASHEGSDTPNWAACIMAPRFQSTLPAREATRFIIVGTCDFLISIHASREGSDAL